MLNDDNLLSKTRRSLWLGHSGCCNMVREIGDVKHILIRGFSSLGCQDREVYLLFPFDIALTSPNSAKGSIGLRDSYVGCKNVPSNSFTAPSHMSCQEPAIHFVGHCFIDEYAGMLRVSRSHKASVDINRDKPVGSHFCKDHCIIG